MQGKEGGRSLRHPKCSPFGLELAGGRRQVEAQAGNGKKKGRSENSRRGGGGRAMGKAEREALAGRPHSSPPTPAGGRHVGKAWVWGSGNLLQDFGPGGHLPSPRLSFPTSKVGVRYLVCRGAITFVKSLEPQKASTNGCHWNRCQILRDLGRCQFLPPFVGDYLGHVVMGFLPFTAKLHPSWLIPDVQPPTPGTSAESGKCPPQEWKSWGGQCVRSMQWHGAAPGPTPRRGEARIFFPTPGETGFPWFEFWPEPPGKTRDTGMHRHTAHRCRERVKRNSQLCGHLP